VVVAGNGDFIVSDEHNHCLRVVTSEGAVRTLVGNGQSGFADGQGADARSCGVAARLIQDGGGLGAGRRGTVGRGGAFPRAPGYDYGAERVFPGADPVGDVGGGVREWWGAGDRAGGSELGGAPGGAAVPLHGWGAGEWGTPKGSRKRKVVSSDSHSMSGSASPPSQSREVSMDSGTPGSAVHKRRRGKSLSDDDSEKAFGAPADDGDKRGRKGRRGGGRGMTDNGLHGEEAGSAAKHKSAPSSPTPASLAQRQCVFASRAGLYMPLLEPHIKWPKADRQEYMMTLVATETCEEVSLAVKECLAGAKPDFAALREKLRAGLQE
jgi:hypothetical protein